LLPFDDRLEAFPSALFDCILRAGTELNDNEIEEELEPLSWEPIRAFEKSLGRLTESGRHTAKDCGHPERLDRVIDLVPEEASVEEVLVVLRQLAPLPQPHSGP
jgi:hypothetical protein